MLLSRLAGTLRAREFSVKRTIRLRGMNGSIKGQTWESSDLLRIGRLDPLEIVLDDNSVSRYHAEVRATDRGWRVRDLGSTNGTRLNGVRLGQGQWPLRLRDLLQFGEVAFVVDGILEEDSNADTGLNDMARRCHGRLVMGPGHRGVGLRQQALSTGRRAAAGAVAGQP